MPQTATSMDDAPRLPARGGSTKIRHFDGTARKTSDWDGLRRDSRLWFDDADCFVYFYGHSASQRGASLKIPLDAVEKLQSRYLMKSCLYLRPALDNYDPGQKYVLLQNESNREDAKYELYIPAPPGLTKDQAFSYHLTTRNLLAYATGRPVVGEKLSVALINLWRRLQDWQIPTRPADFTAFLEKQGYLDYTENPEHALACLKLADDARIRDIWIDSFVHCVGMRERLDLSPEYIGLSHTIAALIMRASLEMDLHIARVVKAVGSFLEDELSASRVGLSRPLRDHLDLFRSFLHAFYVNRFGYFPPRATNPWNKRPWASMKNDFQNLYDYLADTASSSDGINSKGFTGGFCVVQNLQYFDVQHGYPSLPHPLPLLPQMPVKVRTPTRGMRTLSLPRTGSAREQVVTTKELLATATNGLGSKAMLSPLIREYQRFERQREASGTKLDVAEARKVRWLLIYGVLQMLKSIVDGPAEVRDAETASYPLCVLTLGAPAWDDSATPLTRESAILAKQRSNEKILVPDALAALEGNSSRISIHPDCEAESAQDFFAAANLSRRDSAASLQSLTNPLKRTASIRSSMHSSVNAIQRSVVGSLTRRHSSRRASLTAEAQQSSTFCQVVIEDYDDVLKAQQEALQRLAVSPSEQTGAAAKNAFQEFDFGFVASGGESIVNRDSLGTHESPNSADDAVTSFLDSESEGESEEESESPAGSSRGSNRSSLYEVDDASTPTEPSSLESSRRDSGSSLSKMVEEPRPPKDQRLVYEPKPASVSGVNGGTYMPKGMTAASKQRRSHTKKPSIASNASYASNASSEYAAWPVQAADIDEAMAKRTCGSTAIQALSNYGIVLGETNVW
ncbi:hypothetical protein BDY17DRAFT_326621 [Neohortaea acidophila]|uniref:DUF8004 domain-containing protein n=1 Tax=Neohortaea acidophila TaxID=245834 RepID=A0A6A6PL49_9PEZI|nr:uncharacterized protein BDY17DRAFT_326621 [Neohortaea acidophila]KAF2480742.1 hypothetical protein BDY17DRAFT_326621 [Neohortaea acidophila]